MSRCVRRICTAPLTSLSASPATSTSVTTRSVNGAHMPERTVPAPWALGRSSSLMRTEAAVGQLLAAVCEGHVGGVIALEASRLARQNRAWHPLIDLCALTETLLMDGDGGYDPRQLHDR